MGLERLSVYCWLEQGGVKLRIGCPTHNVEAVRVTSNGGVQLVCGEAGCPLGQWSDEASFRADIEAIREKLRVEYLEPLSARRER